MFAGIVEPMSAFWIRRWRSVSAASGSLGSKYEALRVVQICPFKPQNLTKWRMHDMLGFQLGADASIDEHDLAFPHLLRICPDIVSLSETWRANCLRFVILFRP